MPKTKYFDYRKKKWYKPDSNKEEIDLANEEDLIKPSFSGKMECIRNESIMLFSYGFINNKTYRLFYGIGIVYRVVKMEKQDLVYVNFGIFRNVKTRCIVAYDNQARRQILTLKRGQVCQIYGLCRYYTSDAMIKGEKKKGLRLGLYAKGISGWYTPTMIDLKRLPPNEDLASPTEKEIELVETFDDVLDSFLNEEEIGEFE